ncbi:MAG: GNAT family N-acetyltransferase [Pirellulaceae bacterium]|nr:GNAT family N-acetyltransferase [Pirellulaceae bacterium]
MGITYFKRFRMELDLSVELFEPPDRPNGYYLLEWEESLLSAHGRAKYESFRDELDSNVFPCLGDREGCHRLMREISKRAGFIEEATWLLGCQFPGQRKFDYCGTIQGLQDAQGTGSIQNLGVTRGHRNQGLGQLLLWHSLDGFRRAGIRVASLEVTAQNTGALRLYERLGFRNVKTVYKAIDVAYA